tara:strand:- start:439 stop:1374 length:936 start_codon:yes stop_codon:yes gene_type:complete
MTTTKVFRGEGDLMVDALVAASQARPSDNAPDMPGFGRDLVPFFDNDGNENSYGMGSGTPPQGPEFTYEYQQPIMAQHNANGGGKKSKKKPPGPGKAQKQMPAPKAVLQRGQQLPVPLANGQPKADNKARPASGNAKPGQKDVPNRWAGPAFGNSPAPNALPVPTFMGGAAPAPPSSSPPQDAGDAIMQMLGQSPPTRAEAPAVHAASAPDLMAMLNIPKQPESAAPAPVPARPAPLTHKAGSSPQLLTPELLAAMVAKPNGGKTAAQVQNDRSSRLMSMQSAHAAPAPPPAPPAAAQGDFSSFLMAKLSA